jgi:hypothetical protein
MPQDKSRCGICRDKPLNELEECYHYPFMADPEVRQDMAEEIELLDSLLVEDAINANDLLLLGIKETVLHIQEPNILR